MNNPETHATLDTIHRKKDEKSIQTDTHTAQKMKKMNNMDFNKIIGVNAGASVGKQCLFLIRHPLGYSYS